MDKLYKSHFLSELKARMSAERGEFKIRKVAKDDPLRWQFSSSSLYIHQLPSGRCVWLDWIPGEGVEREFFVYLGWSFDPSVLPHNRPGDIRVHSLKGPTYGFAAGHINVQAVEGRQAILGFKIATPWDQLYRLRISASEDERKQVMNKAYAEHLALPDSQRVEAVHNALNEAFDTVNSVLPRFTLALESISESGA
jgi:hypothetical protein